MTTPFTQQTNNTIQNVVIIGTGIAGLTAAVYNARANLAPLVIGGPEEGGQLTLTTEVENFPGFEHGIMGPELVAVTRKQAQRFGATFMTGNVKEIVRSGSLFLIHMEKGDVITSRSVIIATGASARWLGIPSEKVYKGRGVSTCATCDGFFYKNKEILVVGGGDSAMEEANYLTKFASKVTIVHRKDTFRASKIMADRALANPKISVVWNAEIAEVIGDGKKVTGAQLKNTQTGAMSSITCDGIFLAIGHVPNTSFVKSLVKVDENGYILTDRYTSTGIPGLFACGDVQDSRYRQAITAAGSGCAASIEAERYLAHTQEH